MLLVFALVSGLWMTRPIHHIDYVVVALVGVSALFPGGVLEWNNIIGERTVLTHYSTTTAPICLGANYVCQREWGETRLSCIWCSGRHLDGCRAWLVENPRLTVNARL